MRDENYLVAILIAILLFIIHSFILSPLGMFDIPRLGVLDFSYRLTRQVKPSPAQIENIVLVSIDDTSLKKMDKKWPWPRSVFAQFIEKIDTFEPKLIGFDLIFLGKSRDSQQDFLLSEAIRDAENVLLAFYIDKKGNYVLPEDIFLDSAWASGFVNKPRDKDLKVRRARALFSLPGKEAIDYSFEIKAAAKYFGISLDNIIFHNQNIVFVHPEKRLRIPVKEDGTIAINYAATFSDFISVPFWKVLEGDVSGEFFRDKIVLIGMVSKAFHDIHHTPLGLLPGVAINANNILMYMTGNFVKQLPGFLYFPLLFLLALITASFTYRLPVFKGLCATVFLLFISTIIYFTLFFHNWRLDYFSVVLLTVLTYALVNFYKYIRLIITSASLKRSVITDDLTSLLTHRYFRFKLRADFKRALRMKLKLSLLIINIDDFQKINEEYSFERADIVLKLLAGFLKENLSRRSLLARWGRESFAALLYRSDTAKSFNYAENIRKKVANYQFAAMDKVSKITLSIGIAFYPEVKVESAEGFITAAAVAAGKAKAQGGNRVYVFDSRIDRVDSGLMDEKGKEIHKQDQLGYVAMDLEERNRELMAVLKELTQAQKELRITYLNAIQALIKALEEKDEYTAGHSERVCEYSLILAKEIGLPAEEIEVIREAALLHDIGKIGLPDSILHKRGKLSREEVKVIHKHQVIGAHILEPIKFLKKHIPIILHHHERYDGAGYPHGLSGDFIPVGAQIVAIADTFDAMTTGRGYNRVLSLREAVAELKKCAGTQFNPYYLEKFIKAIESKES